MKTSESDDGTMRNMNDAVIVDRLVALVLERLQSRRVGFVWPDAPVWMEPAAGFTWVHYTNARCGKMPSCYVLDELKHPDREAGMLDMLVVPSGSVSLLAELVSGLAASRTAILVSGALRARIPVLFGTSSVLEWNASADDDARSGLLRAIDCMRGKGLEFLGFSTAPHRLDETAGATVRLDEAGWISWPEIAGTVQNAKTVLLSEGTKLTPEAMDRLANLKIRLVKGAC